MASRQRSKALSYRFLKVLFEPPAAQLANKTQMNIDSKRQRPQLVFEVLNTLLKKQYANQFVHPVM
jgi:hypothetical protein